jgi:endonuclease YncB( thermonuclease family)
MVTGYTSNVIAEARQRITFIDQAFAQFNTIINEATAAEHKRQDSTQFYKAARSLLISIDTDVALLKDFVNKHLKDLEVTVESGDVFVSMPGVSGLDYYKESIKHFDDRLLADESIIVVPASGIIGAPPIQQEDPSFDGTCVSVADGDTLTVDERYIRMAGIDAPELGTERGKISKTILERMVLGKKVHVGVDFNLKFDMYSRWLGVVYLAEDNLSEGLKAGTNIDVEMIARCAAVPNLKFGKHHYIDPDENKRVFERCVMGWPMEAEVTLNTKPPHCTVLVDGKDTGQLSGKGSIKVPIGTHIITMYKMGYGALNVVENFESRKYDKSYELAALGANFGLVEIHTNPDHAIVIIDGAPVGLSTVVTSFPTDSDITVGATTATLNPKYTSVRGLLGQIVKVMIDLTEKEVQQPVVKPVQITTGPVVPPVAIK